MKSEEEIKKEIRFQKKQREINLAEGWCAGEFDAIVVDIDARINALEWVLNETI